MGFFRKVFQFKNYVLVFAAGYLLHRCVAADERYVVKRVADAPYLFDRATKRELPIDADSFQVGSAEYRLQGLVTEPNLVQRLQTLKEGGK